MSTSATRPSKKSIEKKDLKLIGHMTQNLLKNFFGTKKKKKPFTRQQDKKELTTHSFPKTKPSSLGCSFSGGKVFTPHHPNAHPKKENKRSTNR
jgi:hypothetical protein